MMVLFFSKSDMGEAGFGGDMPDGIGQDEPKDDNRDLPIINRPMEEIKSRSQRDVQSDKPLADIKDDKNKFFGDIMNGVPNSYFKTIGPLICYVKPQFVNNEDEETCKAMMEAMRECIDKLVSLPALT